MARSFAFVVLSLALGATSLAAAQDEASRAQAREQFGQGVRRYEAADYQGALEAFQEAYRLAPHPMVRVNMANCYEHLGRPLEALHHFERFLAEAESASRQQRREVETAIRRLQGRIGEVRLSVAPDGALVTIDSAETRRAPMLEPVRLAAGTHHLEVRLEGYRTERREIQVVGGESTRIQIQLERGADPPPVATRIEPAPRPTAAPVSPSRAEEAAAAASADEVEQVPEPDLTGPGRGFALRITTPVIVSASAAAALTLAAVVSGALALTANDDFEAAVVRSNDPSLSQLERERARQDGFAAASDADTASILTDLFIAGAITGAGLTVFFLVVEGMDGGEEASAHAERPRVVAIPSVTREGGGVVLQGSF